MKAHQREPEPLCETSEKGEKLVSKQDLVPVSAEIGRRILEIFGYQKISNIVFRLKSTKREIEQVIDNGEMPSVELLLAIHEITGASLHWILTGKGDKFPKEETAAREPGARTRHRARSFRPHAR